MMRLLIISIASIVLMLNVAYAEELIIWAPSKMIVGEEYEGVVIVKEASGRERSIMISTDNGNLDIEPIVTIPPYKNHGIFKIIPKDVGESSIFAVLNQNFTSIKVTTYKTGEHTRTLKIILQADSTKIGKVLGYIFLVDEFGIPIKADKDINIKLLADRGIRVIDSLEIERGEYYTSFIADVEDDGYVYAIAEGIKPTKEFIEIRKDEIKVKVAIAPHITLQNSKAYLYVWLEKDGMPYIPEKDLKVTLTSSDALVASFTPMFKGLESATTTLNFEQGYIKKEVYTRNIGNATLTALINGVGIASTNLIVGGVEISTVTVSTNATSTNATGGVTTAINEAKSIETTVRVIPIDEDAKATDIITYIYPSLIGRGYTADGIVALYNFEGKEEEPTITIGTNNTVIITERNVTRIMPVPNKEDNYRFISLASNGLEHPEVLYPTVGEISKHATIFPITANRNGNYQLWASGPEIKPSKSILDVRDVYEESNRLAVKILPVLEKSYQPLAIVSLVDGNGTLVGVEDIEIIHDPSIEIEVIKKSTAYEIRGSIDKSIDITVVSRGDTINLMIEPTRIVSMLELDMVNIAHDNEHIPFALHLTNNGIPVMRVRDYNTSGMPINDERIIANNGSMIFSTRYGIATGSITTFLNQLSLDLEVSNMEGELGEDAIIIFDTEGEIMIDTELPYKIDGNKIVIEFDRLGVYNVTLMAHREGYKSVMKEIQFTITKLVTLNISSKNISNNDLMVDFTLNAIEGSNTLKTPYKSRVQIQTINLTFPNIHNNLDFQRAIVRSGNGSENFLTNSFSLDLLNDTYIDVIYGKNVVVNVVDGEGSGAYPIGSIVTISAKDKDIIPFLIVNRFDHWEGLPANLDSKSNPLVFEANEGVNATAVYRIDYSGLALPAAAIATIVIMKFRRRK